MKLKLEEITEDGWSGSFECSGLNPGDLGGDVEGIAALPRADLFLMPAEDGLILATGKARAVLELKCGRCLDVCDHEIAVDIAMSLLPRPAGGREEVELAGDEMDVLFYEDDELDLCELVLSEISLAIPMAPVCDENCPGICPICGGKHRAGQCAAKTEQSDPRWAKLAQLKIEN